MTNCCRFAVLAPLFFLLTTFANGSDKFDLGPGTSDRAALLDVIRPAVEEVYGEPVIFLVKSLQQKHGRVLAWLEPAAKKTGKPLGPQRHYKGRLTGYVYALAERNGATWKLIATNVFGNNWTDFEKTVNQHAKGLLRPPQPGNRDFGNHVPPWMRTLPPLPARCIPLVRSAETFDAPRGAKGAPLPANTHLRLGKLDGEWVQVAYTPGAGLNECSEMAVHKQRTWIRMLSLSGPAVLAQDFVPLDADANPLFDYQWIEGDTPTVKFHASTPLLDAELLGYSHQELHLYTIYTGSPVHPLALFYTGFNSEMYGDAASVVLFGAGKVTAWEPERGNRVTPALVSVEPGHLVIREAFLCALTMDTTLVIGAQGVERRNINVFIGLDDERGEVSEPITLFSATDRKHSITLAPGHRIEAISGYDMETRLAQVWGGRKGSEEITFRGWIELEDLRSKMNPVFFGIACCGCG